MKISNRIFALTPALLLFSTYTSAGAKYDSSWHENFHTGIAKTLSKNNVRGCGQFKYKPSTDFPDSEFLVYCTRDGKNWVAYQVWTAIDEVMGPFKPGSNFQ